MLAHCSIVLRLGDATLPVSLLARDGALVATLLDHTPTAARAIFARRGALPAEEEPELFRGAIEELRRYEAGEPVVWRTPFRFEEGTERQREFWQRIAEVPPGSTLTYGELAARAGTPRGARAAGAACGRNPLPLRIPCHRVVAAGGALGGFTGLLATKRLLLAHEGALAAGVAATAPRARAPTRGDQPWLREPRTPSFFTL